MRGRYRHHDVTRERAHAIVLVASERRSLSIGHDGAIRSTSDSFLSVESWSDANTDRRDVMEVGANGKGAKPGLSLANGLDIGNNTFPVDIFGVVRRVVCANDFVKRGARGACRRGRLVYVRMRSLPPSSLGRLHWESVQGHQLCCNQCFNKSYIRWKLLTIVQSAKLVTVDLDVGQSR
jgi:hypothetical protein